MAMRVNKLLNSGRFPKIEESVEHSRTNPLAIQNVSFRRDYMGVFLTDAPKNLAHLFLSTLESDAYEMDLEDELLYRPEAVSERVYGTPDLWYLVMMANKITYPTELAGPRVRYYSERVVGAFLSFADKMKGRVAESRRNPTRVEDRVLVSID